MEQKDMEIHKGLVGVYADTTEISKINKETNSLLYRGYPVQELCEKSTFEEVAHLLLFGELPTDKDLKKFQEMERSHRQMSPELINVLKSFPQTCHPMGALRTAVSYMGLQDKDAWTHNPQDLKEKAVHILGALPSVVAAIMRLRNGQELIEPRMDLGFCENFFNMCFGKVPDPKIVKAFDVSMILYAEHTLNASTFTARVIVSSLSDIYSAVVGAIGALKGPLHGGANEEVMHMLTDVGEPEKAKDWMLGKIERKEKIMGFGHRVYKNGDSRVPTMTKSYHDVASLCDGEKWVEISNILEQTMIEEKGIYPNLDFPAGPAYYLMGFDIPIFTPIFVMSRITGWSAHIIEQLQDNRLIRPSSVYVGHEQRSVR